MEIDTVSTRIITIALYLDQIISGSVSELWISEKSIEAIKKDLPRESEVKGYIDQTKLEIDSLTDNRRRLYLHSILSSLIFQIINHSADYSYQEFSQQTYQFPIKKVSEEELFSIEYSIQKIEKKLGSDRFEILYKQNTLNTNEYEKIFAQNVQKIKKLLPPDIVDFEDNGFLFETTTHQPWSAFNTHYKPFSSKLTLNTDVGFNQLDLYRLACHEAYGGHHSELSHKDSLLIEEGMGEHGLVITFSPQTFISEAIAEGMYALLNILDQDNPRLMLSWYYDRLIFALQNLATFLFFDEKKSKNDIQKIISAYTIAPKTVKNIINFSTDPLFGKYAPVYYSAFNFIEKIFHNTERKEELVKTLFTKPCTPDLISTEFTNKNKQQGTDISAPYNNDKS